MRGSRMILAGAAALMASHSLTAGQPQSLALNTDDTCSMPGQTVTVTLDMTGMHEPIVGGQFFLEYDIDNLTLVSVEPGGAPFTEQIYECSMVEQTGMSCVMPIPGQIDYSVGVPLLGGMGTSADSTLAVLTFTAADEICGTDGLVAFRAHSPPTRLTVEGGGEIVPELSDLPAITIDGTPPAITCPANVTVQCIEDADPGIPFGTVSGGVAIYYNSNGMGETPDNQSYLRSQYSATNSNGGQFVFDSTPLTGNGLTWSLIFNELGQYGLDVILPNLLTADGSNPPPTLIAVDNTDSTPAGAVPAGPVTWAINDYKGAAPNGPGNPATSPVNSIVRGGTPPAAGDVVITRNDLTFSAGVYTSFIEGYLESDDLFHWFNPAEPGGNGDGTTDMADFFLTGRFYFSGVLEYDLATDMDPLQDFYAGDIDIIANFPSAAAGFATATDACTAFPVIAYSDVVSGGDGCSAAMTITRTWTATDECGNVSSCMQTITVEDTTPPVFLLVPDDVTVDAEVGGCTAMVEIATATASDNCDGGAAVTFERSDNAALDLDDPYATGITTITWTADDGCGNVAMDTTVVTVNGVNDLKVTVELSPTVDAGPFTRCITFELWNCAGPPVVVSQQLEFTNGVANAMFEVPCGAYTCITARDELHTLRSTEGDFGIVGWQYVADFTGADQLVGGNLNDDDFIDILDFGVFVGAFGDDYLTGDTTCATAFPHGDIDGDGLAGGSDYTFISLNFLAMSEADCCGAMGLIGLLGHDKPLERISVRDLHQRGMGRLSIADLNQDGWLDTLDAAAFAAGARP